MALGDYLNSAPVDDEGDSEDDLGYIGMPKGYVATKPGYGGPVSPRQAERLAVGGRFRETQITPPRYTVGAEMEPRSWSPERIAAEQQKLVAIGELTKYRLGVWDSTSINAYRRVLAYANQGGLDKEDAYMQLLSSPKGDGGGGAGGAADVPQGQLRVYQASDPAGVRQTAEQAFRQTIGRKPTKKELDTFTSSFLGRERGSQEEEFRAQDRLEGRNADAAAAVAGAAMGAMGGGGGSEADILWERLQRMIADAPGRITPGKRTRSYEEQLKYWNNSPAMGGNGPLAAKPGTSKHGDGRANDLKYENQAVKRWALQNAHKYGLSFPLLNHGEDWHIEVAKGSLPAGHSHGDGHNHGGVPGAALDETVTVQRQDLGAQAIEFARNSNPTETAAYDIGGQMNSLLQILSKSVV